MKKFIMMVALVGFCSTAFAHIPEGQIRSVFSSFRVISFQSWTEIYLNGTHFRGTLDFN